MERREESKGDTYADKKELPRFKMEKIEKSYVNKAVRTCFLELKKTPNDEGYEEYYILPEISIES